MSVIIQGHGGQDNNVKIDFKEDFSVTTNLLGPNSKGIDEISSNIHEINHYPPQNFEPYLSNFADFLFNDHERNNNILLGNGASELIDLAIRNVDGDTWRPSYSAIQFMEYERSTESNGKKKVSWNDKRSNLICLINPNNPTGDYKDINQLKSYIVEMTDPNVKTHVIVDESMQIWHGPEWRSDSLVSQTEWIRTMAEKNVYVYIIHSWTKIFSCTGIRYGSIVCPTKDIYERLRSRQVPWSVNILALKYIDACIKDRDYLDKTWNLTKETRAYQVKELKIMFPTWLIKGHDFLSWIWIDTHDSDIAELCYNLAKFNGTPIRHGKMGYKMDTHIRIAVRDRVHFESLLKALEPVSRIVSSKQRFNDDRVIKTIHLDIDPKIIHSFEWIDVNRLGSHEHYIQDRHSKFLEYLKEVGDMVCIPAIIVCKDSMMTIDGHHRKSIIKALGYEKAPCLLIDYSNDNIVVNLDKDISKDSVMSCTEDNLLEPKSTAHIVRDNNGVYHPLQVLSPIVKLKQLNEIN